MAYGYSQRMQQRDLGQIESSFNYAFSCPSSWFEEVNYSIDFLSGVSVHVCCQQRMFTVIHGHQKAKYAHQDIYGYLPSQPLDNLQRTALATAAKFPPAL